MNQEVINAIAKVNVENALDFLASKHDTTAQNIATLISAGHENLTNQFIKLMKVGIKETFEFIGA